MKFLPNDPPRTFRVGVKGGIEISDCGRIELAPDEQVTFTTSAGGESDFVRKTWGFYATPSLNRRLPRFGLRPALGRGTEGTYFVWLVERGREADFEAYCRTEGTFVAAWLDDRDALETIERVLSGPGPPHGASECPCRAGEYEPVFSYDAPPPGEMRHAFPPGSYRRAFWRCRTCGHFVAAHEMKIESLYDGAYVDSTYGDAEGLRRAFERVMNLSPDASDNAGRAVRVLAFAEGYFREKNARPAPPTVLDVGSGLCVFLSRMKAAGWDATALDPDPRAARHAEEIVGVRSVHADFLAAKGLGRYDAVTFNKVLEHVRDPIPFLGKAREVLAPGGFAYVEVPDGEAAMREGPGREEFFIEHWHAYSAASLAITATRAGLEVRTMERLREPSGKFTLRAFLTLSKSP